MEPLRTPLGASDPSDVAAFWQRCQAATGRPDDASEPEAWAFGDSVELANKLIALVLDGTKRATAGALAAYQAEDEPLPQVGDLEIALDGAMKPRALLEYTEVFVAPLSSVDDQFAWDEGEGDRSRTYWLSAHTDFFSRTLPNLGVEFDPDMATVFHRFQVAYQE